MRKKTRNPILKERCPVCYKYDYVGDQGYGRFFCASCCVEFKKTPQKKDSFKIEIFTIDEDGKQTLIDSFIEKDGIECLLDEYKI